MDAIERKYREAKKVYMEFHDAGHPPHVCYLRAMDAMNATEKAERETCEHCSAVAPGNTCSYCGRTRAPVEPPLRCPACNMERWYKVGSDIPAFCCVGCGHEFDDCAAVNPDLKWGPGATVEIFGNEKCGISPKQPALRDTIIGERGAGHHRWRTAGGWNICPNCARVVAPPKAPPRRMQGQAKPDYTLHGIKHEWVHTIEHDWIPSCDFEPPCLPVEPPKEKPKRMQAWIPRYTKAEPGSYHAVEHDWRPTCDYGTPCLPVEPPKARDWEREYVRLAREYVRLAEALQRLIAEAQHTLACKQAKP